MPAAAVIPAPIAYIRVVAVKKLVVVGGERGRKAEECQGAQRALRECVGKSRLAGARL